VADVLPIVEAKLAARQPAENLHCTKKLVGSSSARASGRRANPALRLTFRVDPVDRTHVPIYGRQFEPGQLQFITTSTYRRARLFTCQRFCSSFAETLRQLRQETGFLLPGWVLMPESKEQ
jgi:hypothetical protein